MSTAVRRLAGLRLDSGWLRLVLLGGGRGAASVLSFLAVLLLARHLPPDDFGRWSLAVAVQGYALHFGELGLRSVVTADAARSSHNLPRLLRRYLTLRLTLSLATLTIVAGPVLLFWPDDALLVTLTTASIIAIALQLDWLALVHDRASLACLLLLVRPAAFLLLLLLTVPALTPERTALVFLAAWWLAALASWPLLRRPSPSPVVPAAPLPSVGAMLRRGSALAIVTLTNQAQLSADLLVVGWCLGAAAAGDYFLASQIAVAGLLFANAAGQIALARLAPLATTPDRFLDKLAGDTVRLLWVALTLAAGLALLGPTLLPLLFGPEHRAATDLLLWLLPWFFLQHPTTLLQSALAAARREPHLLLANAVMFATLLPGLAFAVLIGTLEAFACARVTAELVRLLALIAGLRLDLPPSHSYTTGLGG